MTNPVYERVRHRDYHLCRVCLRGSQPTEVHHIILRSAGGEDVEDNLILLCKDHHMDAHGTRLPGTHIAAWWLQFMLDFGVSGERATERTIQAHPTCRTCEYRRGDWTCAVWDAQDCDPRYGCNAWILRRGR